MYRSVVYAIWLCAIAIPLVCSLAWPHQHRSKDLGMVTGPPTGTALQFGEDIAAVAIRHGLRILVKPSEGALHNLRRLISGENAALAIVQADVLGYLSWSAKPAARHIGNQLRMIFPLHHEEVHLLAHKSIQQVPDLASKRVIIGTKGSGTYLTARRLLQMFDVTPATLITDHPPPEALHAVLTGQADAMFHVDGKPVPLFTNLQALSGDPRYADLVDDVHFVSLPGDQLNRVYHSGTIGPQDYPWVSTTTPTVTVQTVLVGFNFSQRQNAYFQMRCAQLATLGRAIRENLHELQRRGHPKWQDVDLKQRTSIWPPDACSQSVRRELMQTEELQQDFDQILKTPMPRQTSQSPHR